MSEMNPALPAWRVASACTLPTAARPVRLAEFDELFATAVRGVDRPEPGRVQLQLSADAAVAARVAHLMVRETECCSFFTFTLVATGGRVVLEVAVPTTQVSVLDALADRAMAVARS